MIVRSAICFSYFSGLFHPWLAEKIAREIRGRDDVSLRSSTGLIYGHRRGSAGVHVCDNTNLLRQIRHITRAWDLEVVIVIFVGRVQQQNVVASRSIDIIEAEGGAKHVLPGRRGGKCVRRKVAPHVEALRA